MLNAGEQELEFEIPAAPPEMSWGRVIDTSRPSPDDIADHATAATLNTAGAMVPAHSITVLQCQDKPVK